MTTQQNRGFETPLSIAADIRRRQIAGHSNLADACSNRPLTITPPADLPADLAQRVNDHNDAVAWFSERLIALDDRTADLPLAMADAAIRAETFAAHAAEYRAERVELLRRHLALLDALEPLLNEVAEALARQAAVAEATLLKAQAAAKKAGHVAASAETEPVRTARDALDDLNVAINATRQRAETIDGDIMAVGQSLVGAWRLLVGPLA
jgi:hypothetical protein